MPLRLACSPTEGSYVSGNHPIAEGITNPPIDELLKQSDSKYKLVLFAAKRARQINAYYSQLGEGLLDHVGPLVETTVQEKPLSIALREVNEGKLRDASMSILKHRWTRTPTRASSLPEQPLPGDRQEGALSRIVLGVSGGIAAYKACELLRRLQGAGHEVTVVPTAAALEFVGVSTWAALSGRPVHTSVFDDVHLVPHVKIGQEVDLVFVAPATADLLARAASGRADDLLTNVLLTAHCPIVFAPAMHTEMWLHAATQANVTTLRSRGAVVVRPDVGRLTGPDAGVGRLPDPAELFAVAVSVLEDPAPRSARRARTWQV